MTSDDSGNAAADRRSGAVADSIEQNPEAFFGMLVGVAMMLGLTTKEACAAAQRAVQTCSATEQTAPKLLLTSLIRQCRDALSEALPHDGSIDRLLPQFTSDGSHARPVEYAVFVQLDLQGPALSRAATRELIKQLPFGHRAVVALYDAAGFPLALVAAALDVSEQRCRTLIHEGRMAMLTLLTCSHASEHFIG